ncbi:MAG: beta-lactamase family protein [Lentisphaerae bacterium]|nr:beta-lactamase family protein [Lentisphaerota bacterium]MBT4817207.1 beta-lactamase family protein [Lentisphaerota bacterium]MBT5608197.1 beta-lactamase family protein [Lentisphaerota bacterium]MBT7058914.1 beta-lactamase family protein [Lentisphaerota bacterium]MBT7842855.1 beta-lactamase family protein [Lentisphaerota bacterium]
MADPHSRFDAATERARGYVTSGHLTCAVMAVAGREGTPRMQCFGQDGKAAPELAGRIYALASISKAITGVAIARLVDQGKLSYSDLITEHLPDFGVDERRRTMTIGQILTHSTGLPARFAPDFLKHGLTTDASYRLLCEDELLYSPGTNMQYSSYTYQLLNEIVARLLGQSMTEFLSETVLSPCGMTDTGFAPSSWDRAMPTIDHPVPMGKKMDAYTAMEMSGSGLWSTAQDLVAMAQAYLEPGRLFSRATFELVTAAQPSLPRWKTDQFSKRTWGWVKEDRPEFTRQPENGFYHGGATGTLLWIDPATDLIFVFLTDRWGSGNEHAFETLDRLYGA